LGGSRFAAKTPSDGGWISLDFLGFSRQNRAFSMGYAGFSAEKFFARLSPALRGAATGACGLGDAEAQDCSCGKLSLVSDYLQ
jgi:hypothetical protein